MHTHYTHAHTIHTCTHTTHMHTHYTHNTHTLYTHAHTLHTLHKHAHTLHTCTHNTHTLHKHAHTLHTCTHTTQTCKHTTHMHTYYWYTTHTHACTLHTHTWMSAKSSCIEPPRLTALFCSSLVNWRTLQTQKRTQQTQPHVTNRYSQPLLWMCVPCEQVMIRIKELHLPTDSKHLLTQSRSYVWWCNGVHTPTYVMM